MMLVGETFVLRRNVVLSFFIILEAPLVELRAEVVLG